MGPLCCSVQEDTVGSECLKKNENLYFYNGEVGVAPLAMVDDLVCISTCGLNSVKMNAFINSKTNIKKLQFGLSKCHKMHVGVSKAVCPDLDLDNWKVKMFWILRLMKRHSVMNVMVPEGWKNLKWKNTWETLYPMMDQIPRTSWLGGQKVQE